MIFLKNILFIALLTSCSFISFGSTKELKFASFNIRWYGLGGEMIGKFSDEYRSSHIKEFISKELKDTDFILFQEIVDVPKFKREVMDGLMKCVTYHRSIERHQYVLLCHKPKFDFVPESDDNDFELNEVASNSKKSRPALQGILLDKNKKPLVRIVGVHLKAHPGHTHTRLKQTKVIANRVSALRKSNIPTVVLGDFNSHIKENSGKKTDDWKLMDNIFNTAKSGLVHLGNSKKNTYRVPPQWSYVLDHIWASKEIKLISGPTVAKACSCKGRGCKRFDNVYFYNRFISDHCPVQVTIKL